MTVILGQVTLVVGQSLSNTPGLYPLDPSSNQSLPLLVTIRKVSPNIAKRSEGQKSSQVENYWIR